MNSVCWICCRSDSPRDVIIIPSTLSGAGECVVSCDANDHPALNLSLFDVTGNRTVSIMNITAQPVTLNATDNHYYRCEAVNTIRGVPHKNISSEYNCHEAQSAGELLAICTGLPLLS